MNFKRGIKPSISLNIGIQNLHISVNIPRITDDAVQQIGEAMNNKFHNLYAGSKFNYVYKKGEDSPDKIFRKLHLFISISGRFHPDEIMDEISSIRHQQGNLSFKLERWYFQWQYIKS